MGNTYSNFKKYSDIRKSLNRDDPEIRSKGININLQDVIKMSIKNQAKFVDSDTLYHHSNEIWCLNKIKNFSDQSHIIKEIYTMKVSCFGNLSFIALNGPTDEIKKYYRRILEIAIFCMKSRFYYEQKFKNLEKDQLQYTITI